MENKVKAVIFDWAGTSIDYGCFAPVQAFIEAFKEAGIEITIEEAREPMGLLKREHIEAILSMERIQVLWEERFNRASSQEDVDWLYQAFEENLFKSLQDFTDPVSGVLETVKALRERNIKIGSTTGYTREMMDIVAEYTKEKGYSPDCIICADEVKKGRPYPYMIFQNMIALDVFPPSQIVKVGDTVSDIEEGKNAGVWNIGVINGSSELGLTEAEVRQLDTRKYKQLASKVAKKFNEAGADFVIDSIDELPQIIDVVER